MDIAMQAKIFETLKVILRARKITYAQLAKQLGTSEPTVKRMFASRDDKLSRIIRICHILGVPLEDVVAQANRLDIKPLVLGDAIETQLAEEPAVFHVLILLRDGMGTEDIQQHYGITQADIFRLGQRLEALGLARVETSGRIRILVEQPIAFRRNGPLHDRLMTLNLDFVRDVFSAEDSDSAGFLTQSRQISDATARIIMADIQALKNKLADMARQDQLTLPAEALTSHKLTAAWAPVDFSQLLAI
ncbi:MAG: helix-turn-helix transcriptional regulator [Pseudomonadota bacterium]